VLLAVREEPNQSITASGIGGDFRCFESSYKIVPLGSQRTRIVYQATLVPEMGIPPIVGLSALRSMMGTQFGALLEKYGVAPKLREHTAMSALHDRRELCGAFVSPALTNTSVPMEGSVAR